MDPGNSPAMLALRAALSAGMLSAWAAFMTTIPLVTVYLDRDVYQDPAELNSWIARAGLRRVDSGARVDLVQADPYVLRRATSQAETPQVTDIRLYGDLLRVGVRGSDAAEHLRETRIGF